MTISSKIGFIGGGQMATALASGFCREGLVPAEQMSVYDVSDAAIAQFLTKLPGATQSQDAAALCRESDVLFLAVKPQHIGAVFASLQPGDSNTLVVSIAAGVTLQRIESELPGHRVIRVMPNTPCLVGAGASAFALGALATVADQELVGRLLSAVGLAIPVAENLLDAVTGLSGSGPAYVFMAIEALSDGGVKAGLPRAVAAQLAEQTVLGAAQLVKQGGEHPAVLKDQVASPGGTTIAGIHALESRGFRAALVEAVVAASDRSRELGQS